MKKIGSKIKISFLVKSILSFCGLKQRLKDIIILEKFVGEIIKVLYCRGKYITCIIHYYHIQEPR